MIIKAKNKPINKTIPANLIKLTLFSEHLMQILFILEYFAPSTPAQMEHKGPENGSSQEEFNPPLYYFQKLKMN